MSPIDANGLTSTKSRSRPWHRDASLLIGVWMFMASTFVLGGAYDTDEFGLLHRIVFWLLVAALIVFQPVLLERILARFAPPSVAEAWLSAAGAVLVAIPLIAVEIHLLKFTPLLPRAVDPWIEFIPGVGAPALIVGGGVRFLRFAKRRRRRRARLSHWSGDAPCAIPGSLS